jgi:hypothetical protein
MIKSISSRYFVNFRFLLTTLVVLLMTSIVAEAQYVESYNNRDLKRVFTSTGTDSILDIQEGQYVLYYGAVAVNLYNDLGGDLMLAWGLDGGCDDQLIHRWNSVRTSKAFIDEEGDIILQSLLRGGCLSYDQVMYWYREFEEDQKLFIDLVLENRALQEVAEP